GNAGMENRQADGNTPIRNKDIPLLRRVVAAMQEVCLGEERIQWLHDRMTFITQRFSQTPGCGGQPMGFDSALASLDDMSDAHRKKVKDCLRELQQAERIINDIPNPNMRTFVTMLYMMELPPAQVRSELNMSKWKYQHVRETVERARDMKSVRWNDALSEEENSEKSKLPVDS
ncbi:MAG: DUF1492 domain-containing protein, partial [Eubacteriales bacterium]|nr:DUF1492 domain-containing protein [Eubacteriales bacterium]